MKLTGRIALLLFLGFPFAELFSILLAAQWFGALSAFLAVIAGGFAGVLVFRQAGRAALRELRNETGRGVIDGRVLAGASRLVIIAVLMMIPGFISDALALVLCVPAIAAALSRRFDAGARRHGPDLIDLDPDEYRKKEAERIGSGPN